MSTQPLPAALEFHLALAKVDMPKELDQIDLDKLHPQYLFDLYPIGDRDANDYANLILDHADTWIAQHVDQSFATPRLDQATLAWLEAYVTGMTEQLSLWNRSLAILTQELTYGLIHSTITVNLKLHGPHATKLAIMLGSMLWLKLPIYGEVKNPIDIWKVARATEAWERTRP